MAKKIATSRSAGSGRYVALTPVRSDIARLSDPEVREAVKRQVDGLIKSKKGALSFLNEIGIATPTGRLTKRYGG